MKCMICHESSWKNVDEFRLTKQDMCMCTKCGFVTYPEKYKDKDLTNKDKSGGTKKRGGKQGQRGRKMKSGADGAKSRNQPGAGSVENVFERYLNPGNTEPRSRQSHKGLHDSGLARSQSARKGKKKGNKGGQKGYCGDTESFYYYVTANHSRIKPSDRTLQSLSRTSDYSGYSGSPPRRR